MVALDRRRDGVSSFTEVRVPVYPDPWPNAIPSPGSFLAYSQAPAVSVRLLSSGTIKLLRLPQFAAYPPHISALGQAALWLTSLIRWSRPGSPRPARLGVINRFHPLPVFGPQGTCGSPKFPENPNVPMPCSWTPAEPWCLAFTAPRCCPPYSGTWRASTTSCDFGALLHGLSTGCLRFVPPLLTTTQNSLPGDGHSFPGGIPVYPLSSIGKFRPFGLPFPWVSLGAIPTAR
jgi:hypothetical protein